MSLLILLFIWTVCGVISWGGVVASWIHDFPKETARDASGLAASMVLLGPVGLLVTIVATNFFQRGWRLR